MILLLVLMIFSPSVFATEAVSSAVESTAPTTTKAPANVTLKGIHMIGSNGKNYLASPSYAAGTNKYTFTLPDWMEEASLVIKGAAGLTITSDDTEFSYTKATGYYTGDFTFKAKTQSFKVLVKNGDGGERTLTIGVTRTAIKTYFEKVAVLNGSDTLDGEGSIADGLEYEVDGDVTSLKLRVTPRHEQEISLQRNNDDPTVLELKNGRYEATLELTGGEDVFTVTSKAGTQTVTVTIKIINTDTVSSEVSSIEEVSSMEEASSEETVSNTDFVSIDNTPAPVEEEDGTSPLIWVLIGVVIAVILGACIFLIVSSGSNRRPPSGNPPRRGGGRSNRDLRGYVDDYDDYSDNNYSGGEYYEDDNYDNGYNFGGEYEDDGYYDDTPSRQNTRRNPPSVQRGRSPQSPGSRYAPKDSNYGYYDDDDDFFGSGGGVRRR